ncbi:NAD(P)H-hydrate dehydratase [Candidatus Marsarchaeota archaeon]|nr:NAD(P)H-hydrate dehydratase [Candidatus Marsarchaeota archaeon]MCL5404575.1 NAD(P)H-hydrate dehydratase [Candidatus Marsarchaeota archaeon]
MQSLKEFTIYTKKYFSIEDSYAIRANGQAMGMDEKMMVENAGSKIADYIRRRQKGKRVLFACGVGGKGAISMSIARHLMNFAEVSVALIGDASSMHNESAKFNFKTLDGILDIKEISQDNISDLRKMLSNSDAVVDGILGVGMRGRLSGLVSQAIKAINESGKYVMSIDVPSGINADTGMKNIQAVEPDLLFVVNKMKAYLKSAGQSYEISVVDIGLPITAELFTGPGDVMIATKPRELFASKYDHGNVLVVGGSTDYKGAPLLSGMASEHALAALRTGSGYVTVYAPANSSELVRSMKPELIVKQLSPKQLSDDDVKAIISTRHEAMVLGPGMQNTYMSAKQLKYIINAEYDKGVPMIIDAAGIRMLSQNKSLIKKGMVITPHDGEFKYLSGIDTSKRPLEMRIHAAMDFASNYKCVLVLKGHETIITNGSLLKINRPASPALATMGSGDVLAGMIAAYAAQCKENLIEAATAAVYVHSKIGDELFAEKGLHITASDIIESIPKALKGFDRISY